MAAAAIGSSQRSLWIAEEERFPPRLDWIGNSKQGTDCRVGRRGSGLLEEAESIILEIDYNGKQ
jgi:hypothetical protein